MSIGTRGKWAEGKFRAWAKLQSEAKLDFAFLRYPDARAGSRVVAPSDFEVLYAGQHYNIEIKEVDHSFRLPHKNFSEDKIARMRKWELAGGASWVVIYFAPAKIWRVETVGWFMHKVGGSWDMSGITGTDFNQAMKEIFHVHTQTSAT